MAGCKAQLEIERWIVNYEGRGPDNRLGIIEGEAPEGSRPLPRDWMTAAEAPDLAVFRIGAEAGAQQ